MEQENAEAQDLSWAESHPWLAGIAACEEEDSVGEVVRYTLDELRLA